MDKYEETGSRCRFLIGNSIEEVSLPDSPFNSPQLLTSLDEDTKRQVKEMKEGKGNFVAAACSGGLLVQ